MTDGYSIEELADETGFDKRVIRSFIEQGLLRGPDTKGRYARYTNAHLVRLRAIKQLRDARGMTLGEIRIALLTMNEDDLRALARNVPKGIHASVSNSSVLDYLNTARQPEILKKYDEDTPHKLSPNQSPIDRLLSTLQENLKTKIPSPQNKGQSWHRFSITPDIELSVRGLQDGGQIEQWDRIAECLREILLGRTE